MKLNEVRNNLVRSMVLIEMASEDLESFTGRSNIEIRIKKTIREQINTCIGDLFITIDIIDQILTAMEDETGMETVGDILANNGSVN